MALSFEAWLKAAGYDTDWYNKLDVMHQEQVGQLYRNSEDEQGYVQTLSSSAKLSLARVAAGKDASEPTPAEVKAQKANPTQSAATIVAGPSGVTDDQLRAAGLSEQYITSLRGQKDTTRQLALTAAVQGNQQVLLGLSQTEANMSVVTQRGYQPYVGPNAGAVNHFDRNFEERSDEQRDTIGNVLNAPNGSDWDKTRILGFQKQLVDAGYLRIGQYVAGDYDTATLNAYHQAILDAARKGLTPDEQIANRADALKGSSGFGFTPPIKQIADPAAVTTIVTKIYNDATGHDPDPKTMKRLVGEYRSFEEKAYQNTVSAARYQQQQSYAQQAGGSTPETPTIQGPQSESDIEAELRGDITTQSAAGDTFAHSMGQQLQTFAQILKGG